MESDSGSRVNQSGGKRWIDSYKVNEEIFEDVSEVVQGLVAVGKEDRGILGLV